MIPSDAYATSLRATGTNEEAVMLLGAAWDYLRQAQDRAASTFLGLPGDATRSNLESRLGFLANTYQEGWFQDPYGYCAQWEEVRNAFWQARAEAGATETGEQDRTRHLEQLADDVASGVRSAGLTLGAAIALLVVGVIAIEAYK